MGAVAEALRVGGLVAVVAILLLVLWAVAREWLVPGPTHREMRQGYQERIAELERRHLAEQKVLQQDRDWYREKLLVALDLAEGRTSGEEGAEP